MGLLRHFNGKSLKSAAGLPILVSEAEVGNAAAGQGQFSEDTHG